MSKKKNKKIKILDRKCPNCKKSTVVRDYKQNIVICNDCGRIIEKNIKDRGPDWRSFQEDQSKDKKRGGSPMTYTIHDKGLSTQIDWKNRDSKGKSLSPERRSRMYRLRKWQRRIRVSDATERNLAFALSEMDRMSSQLGIPRNVREISAKIYREAVERHLIRGRSIEGVASAALYAGCRKTQMPRTLEEMTEVSRVEKKEIARSYRFLTRELDLHIPPTDPANYVSRFGSELDISGKAKTTAIKIIKNAQEKGLTSGRGPKGIAAAAIYIASIQNRERRTQRKIAQTARVTEVTVRNRYKELVNKLNLEINI